MKTIRCATIATYMGPYAANYIHSALYLDQRVRGSGGHMIHVFPAAVRQMEWLRLFEKINAKVYFVEYDPYSLDNIMGLRKIFRVEKINVIHSHFSGWDITVKLAAPEIPVIWHERMNIDIVNRSKRIKNWVKFNVIGRFNTYSIGASDEVYKEIAELTGNRRCVGIPNAIQFDRLQTTYKPRFSKPFRLLFFGWSPRVKGVDIACKACEILNAQEQLVELYMVSQEESQKYIEENFPVRPEWLKVLTPCDDVGALYSSVDGFLSAARSEAFCNSLLEAIYSGRPAIYSDIKNTRWADDFKNTYRYSVESPEELAEAMRKCIASEVTEDAVRSNAQLATSKYSMDSWCDQVINVIKTVIRK